MSSKNGGIVNEKTIEDTRHALDAWVCELMTWHFSEETGCPFWLNFRNGLGWDPRNEIRSYADLQKLGAFQDQWMRDTPLELWVPNAYAGQPYHVFETGGTTGRPKQRLDWEDFQIDYKNFSLTLDTTSFPIGGNWLMLGPTGPRRLRLAIEYLVNLRGGACFHLDLDPRWVVKLLHSGQVDTAKQYMQHVLDQAINILDHRPIACIFTTPRLLEALCEQVSLQQYKIRGVMCGGTSMTPQTHRFFVEELLKNIKFVPVYGNTLMGLAACKPFDPSDGYNIIYYPPQPRAVLEVVKANSYESVPYGETGRIKLTTLTRELFMPNFIERDQAIRVRPTDQFPWDGVMDVKPYRDMGTRVVEGVY